jgi:hypothetical protein
LRWKLERESLLDFSRFWLTQLVIYDLDKGITSRSLDRWRRITGGTSKMSKDSGKCISPKKNREVPFTFPQEGERREL